MKKMRSNKWKVAACVAGLALVSASTAMGQGYAGPVISPNSLNFGNVAVGTASTVQTVSVQAPGGKSSAKGNISISAITFPTGFSRSGGTCPASGAAPDPCTLGVVFTPTVIGTQAGNAVISASVNGSPPGSSNLALTGNGVSGQLISVPTLGALGLGLLLSGLLASGVYFVRRR